MGHAVSLPSHSVAIDGELAQAARRHLIREDGQEDLCFALWRSSSGRTRKTAILFELVLPNPGERQVHGNASFNHAYFERATRLAFSKGCGLAFMHSHPVPGWQDMSPDDVAAERDHASASYGATNLPLVGLTIGSDGTWSGRFWERIERGKFRRIWCGSVRVCGTGFQIDFAGRVYPPPEENEKQVRTRAAWGADAQAKIARLRIGVVGLGSVGAIVAEALARTGLENVVLIDFDRVEEHNLDRLLSATPRDARLSRLKVDVAADALEAHATAMHFHADRVHRHLQEQSGYTAALDCDVLFSCADRPLPRHLLNLIAQAHLIPVIDGGILATQTKSGRLLSADWRSHVVGPHRRCLACIGQYDPGLVAADREGLLDDPTYIAKLDKSNPLVARENVFVYSAACASAELLQLLSYIISPLGIQSLPRQMYHSVPGILDSEFSPEGCDELCLVPRFLAAGDQVTGILGIEPDRELTGESKAKYPVWARLMANMLRRMRTWLRALSRPRSRNSVAGM